MNTYVKKNGETFKGPFMKAPKLLPGHYWRNVSSIGAAPMRFVETAY